MIPVYPSLCQLLFPESTSLLSRVSSEKTIVLTQLAYGSCSAVVLSSLKMSSPYCSLAGGPAAAFLLGLIFQPFGAHKELLFCYPFLQFINEHTGFF